MPEPWGKRIGFRELGIYKEMCFYFGITIRGLPAP